MVMVFSLLKSRKKILFVATEAAPFVKVGGLGEVMYSLPRALSNLGHDVRVMIPLYATIDSSKYELKLVKEGLKVEMDTPEPIISNIKMYEAVASDSESPVTTYFLENMEYFEKRANVYGYDDDAARWAVLSKNVIEFIRTNEDWRPDIIVAADWQGGLIPNYIHKGYKDDPIISKIAVVFAIHNLYFQGMFDHNFVSEMDYDDGLSDIPGVNDPRLLKINFMRRGIRFADMIATVSPTYAREITTPEYGEKLDLLLAERRSRLFGVLNGIDYQTNNPDTDPIVEHHYTESNISGREKNKAVLRQRFNLPDDKDIPIIGMVTRLAEQKGLDLVMDVLDKFMDVSMFQFVIVGTGDRKYMAYFDEVDKKYQNVAAHLSYDSMLPSLVYAGADAILIPSKYEPCGLTQMEAMRYGAIPIVRKTGGLADSVEDYSPAHQTGTGFVFESYNSYALFGAIVRMLETYKYKEFWKNIQKRAMKVDFSWKKSAQEYEKLFDRAITIHAGKSQ